MERDIKRCQIHNRFNYLYAILEYMTCIVVDLCQMKVLKSTISIIS